ncbi:hypothetical protein QI202_00390 [Staphylococcus saprophyticus]|uniref:hypothetical protein n=1 Tax=Staphylococcus saprophyticus TaxID=29385 RepID=UPI000254AF21|nr:hypothetical protein [Staphylococcus saprophyticus]EHY92655.1 hypothetical protein SSME_09780 [Staphylococcus saprophyticus subsp. saprophyticus KACC 16562]MDW4264042.1 hypothetical protein [Staphylococcus saprophyticus]
MFKRKKYKKDYEFELETNIEDFHEKAKEIESLTDQLENATLNYKTIKNEIKSKTKLIDNKIKEFNSLKFKYKITKK